MQREELLAVIESAKSAGLPYRVMALRAGITPAAISMFRSGRAHMMHLRNARKLVRAIAKLRSEWQQSQSQDLAA